MVSFKVAAGGTRLRLNTYTPNLGPLPVFNLNPLLELYGPNGTRVASDDNSGGDGRNAELAYDALAAGTYKVRVHRVSGFSDVFVLAIDRAEFPSVAGRYVFYNGSGFDGGDAAADARDDAAVAPDKRPLIPGESASAAKYTGFTDGITGVMVDVKGMPAGAALTADDFVFRSGTTADPAAWAAAPQPAQITVRRGAGAGGSDRVTLTWPAGRIKNTWLQVTLRANDRTGLGAADTFYIGNLAADAGDVVAGPGDAVVNSLDLGIIRRHLFEEAGP